MKRIATLPHTAEVPSLDGMTFAAGLHAVTAYLEQVLAELPDTVVGLLPVFTSVDAFAPATEVIDALDDQYFDLEDAGDLAQSKQYFCAARFAQACSFMNVARDIDTLNEAIFEGHAALGAE